jgi:CubicO group peptidase (beta-lactamase class C family)
MLHRRSLLLGGLALSFTPPRAWAEGAPEQDLAALLKERVDVGRESMGLVAGILDGDRRSVAAYGSSGSENGRPLDADTGFEIGSITKVFTALLFADMVVRGEVAPGDPVAKFLPADVHVPDFEGKPITLLDLATYTSGLPRLPTNFAPIDKNNPYLDYTVGSLYAFLSSYKLGYAPGTHYEYANLGFGLLGHALALRAGLSYEELVVSRICAPLGMDSTRIALSPSMKERLARGHDSGLGPVANWDIPVLAGAGALRSTANDLLTFLDMCMGNKQTPLAAAMTMTLGERRPTSEKGPQVGSGWFISTRHRDEIAWKDGGTGGYASYIGFSTKTRRASILLSNAADWTANLMTGMHLVNAAYPLPQLRRQVSVDPQLLASYAGRYELTPNFALTVRASGAHLYVQATGQAEYEAFAESDRDFFYRVVDAQITFDPPDDGMVRSLILHQNGKDRPGRRVIRPD